MGVYAQKEMPAVDTAQDLRAIAAREYHAATPLIYVRGMAAAQDGYQGLFEWQPSNSAADDAINTIRPNWVPSTAQGRWVRLTANALTPLFTAKTVTANYTFSTYDSLVRADATGGAFTVTLPLIAGAQKRAYVVKKIDSSANSVTISGDANIDGASSVTVSFQNEAKSFMPNDQNTWDIV